MRERALRYQLAGEHTSLHSAEQFRDNDLDCPAQHPAHAAWLALKAQQDRDRAQQAEEDAAGLARRLAQVQQLGGEYVRLCAWRPPRVCRGKAKGPVQSGGDRESESGRGSEGYAPRRALCLERSRAPRRGMGTASRTATGRRSPRPKGVAMRIASRRALEGDVDEGPAPRRARKCRRLCPGSATPLERAFDRPGSAAPVEWASDPFSDSDFESRGAAPQSMGSEGPTAEGDMDGVRLSHAQSRRPAQALARKASVRSQDMDKDVARIRAALTGPAPPCGTCQALMKVQHGDIPEYHGAQQCDKCERSDIASDPQTWHCRACKYDLCTKCATTQEGIDKAMRVYKNVRAAHIATPSFYFYIAEALRNGGAPSAVCTPIALNVLEMCLPSAQSCRAVAYFLVSVGEWETALQLLHEVKEPAPEEPQSFSDIALVTLLMARQQRHEWDREELRDRLRAVVDNLVAVCKGTWPRRFADIEWPCLILRPSPQPTWASRVSGLRQSCRRRISASAQRRV